MHCCEVIKVNVPILWPHLHLCNNVHMPIVLPVSFRRSNCATPSRYIMQHAYAHSDIQTCHCVCMYKHLVHTMHSNHPGTYRCKIQVAPNAKHTRALQTCTCIMMTMRTQKTTHSIWQMMHSTRMPARLDDLIRFSRTHIEKSGPVAELRVALPSNSRPVTSAVLCMTP